MLGGHQRVAHRILIEFTLSLSKGLDSEFVIGERFVETKRPESENGFEGRSVLRNRHYFKVIVLKGFIFSYFFS